MTDTTTETRASKMIDNATISRGTRLLLIAVVGLSLIVTPVAAQSDGGDGGSGGGSDVPSICNEDGMGAITGMISGWVTVAAALGTMLMVAVWQADILAELVTSSPEGKQRVKRHKRSAAKSGLMLLALGPGVTVAGKVMGIPFVQCVDLIPF